MRSIRNWLALTLMGLGGLCLMLGFAALPVAAAPAAQVATATAVATAMATTTAMATVPMTGTTVATDTMTVPGTTTPGAATGGAQVLNLNAGETATLQIRGFCLDPGKPFPNAFGQPAVVATDTIRSALYYAVQQGYDQSNPDQVQEAVWYLQTGTWQHPSHDLGQQIVNAAQGMTPPAAPAGTSVLDALGAHNVSMQVSFSPAPGTAPGQAFYGDGTIQVTNSGSSQMQVYLPFGTIFPPADPTTQRLVAFVTGTNQTPTPAATNSPAGDQHAVPDDHCGRDQHVVAD